MTRDLLRHLPWLAGFVLTVNIYLVPPLASSPRAVDLGALILAVWLVMALARGRIASGPLVLACLAALPPLAWLFFGTLAGDGAAVNQAARWVLAVPWAVALLPVLDDADRRRRFAWGLMVGGFANVGVILAQYAGLEALLSSMGLSPVDAAYHHWVGHTLRLPGLHGQHNSSSSVVSLMIPVGIYLYDRRHCGLPVLLASWVGFAVTAHLTSTRSPVIVVVLTVVYAAVAARRLSRIVLLGVMLAAVVAPLIVVYGPPGGWSRWKNVEALTANAGERIDSNVGALVLIATHPQGMGVEAARLELADRTAIAATHNAFLQAGLFFGAALGLLVLLGMGAAILRGLSGPAHPGFLLGLLAFQMAGLFMFEEHLNNPTFVVLCMVCIAALGRSNPGRTNPRRTAQAGRLSGAEDLPPVG